MENLNYNYCKIENQNIVFAPAGLTKEEMIALGYCRKVICMPEAYYKNPAEAYNFKTWVEDHWSKWRFDSASSDVFVSLHEE